MMGFLPDSWLPRRSPAGPDIVVDDGPQAPERPMDAQSSHWAVWRRDGVLRAVEYYPAPHTFHQVVDDLDADGLLYVGTDRGDRLEPISEARARELSAQSGLAMNHRRVPVPVRAVELTIGNRDAVFTPAPGAALPHVPEPAADADPGAANRRPDFPEPPDYSCRAQGAVARIDAALDENLRAANQRLRADLRAAIDHGRTVELERDTALARIAELELTLKALGRFVVHAAKHDTEGGA